MLPHTIARIRASGEHPNGARTLALAADGALYASRTSSGWRRSGGDTKSRVSFNTKRDAIVRTGSRQRRASHWISRRSVQECSKFVSRESKLVKQQYIATL